MRYKNSEPWALSEVLRALNQMEWESRSPEGFHVELFASEPDLEGNSDETPTWLNPDVMRVRLNIAQFVSHAFLPNCTKKVPALATVSSGPPCRRKRAAALPPPAHCSVGR